MSLYQIYFVLKTTAMEIKKLIFKHSYIYFQYNENEDISLICLQILREARDIPVLQMMFLTFFLGTLASRKLLSKFTVTSFTDRIKLHLVQLILQTGRLSLFLNMFSIIGKTTKIMRKTVKYTLNEISDSQMIGLMVLNLTNGIE